MEKKTYSANMIFKNMLMILVSVKCLIVDYIQVFEVCRNLYKTVRLHYNHYMIG